MKTLKFYETPEVETVDIEIENQILAGSPSNDPNFPVEEPVIE